MKQQVYGSDYNACSLTVQNFKFNAIISLYI